MAKKSTSRRRSKRKSGARQVKRAPVKTFEPEVANACVLYDADNGRILHVHRTLVFAGGRMPDKATIESRAREVFTRSRGERPIRALHVDEVSLKPGALFKIDLEKRTLVEIPRRKALPFLLPGTRRAVK
jgi:hypothetical protein